jgi:hypothetical protein
MPNSIDVAILTKGNDLANRYGLKPYDFIATFDGETDDFGPNYILRLTAGPQDDALREERYEIMLQSLGVDVDGPLNANGIGTLTTPYSQIIDALDTALQNAPRPRRF